MNETVTTSESLPPIQRLTYEQGIFVVLGSLVVLVCVLFGLIVCMEEQSNKRRQAKRKKVYPNELI